MFHTERSRLALTVTIVSAEGITGKFFVKVKESDPPLFGERFSFVTNTLENDKAYNIYWRQSFEGSAAVKLNTKPPLSLSSIAPLTLRFSLREIKNGAVIPVGSCELHLFQSEETLSNLCEKHGLVDRLYFKDCAFNGFMNVCVKCSSFTSDKLSKLALDISIHHRKEQKEMEANAARNAEIAKSASVVAAPFTLSALDLIPSLDALTGVDAQLPKRSAHPPGLLTAAPASSAAAAAARAAAAPAPLSPTATLLAHNAHNAQSGQVRLVPCALLQAVEDSRPAVAQSVARIFDRLNAQNLSLRTDLR